MFLKFIVAFIGMALVDILVTILVIKMLPKMGINYKEMALSSLMKLDVTKNPTNTIGLLGLSLLAIAGYIAGLMVFIIVFNLMQ